MDYLAPGILVFSLACVARLGDRCSLAVLVFASFVAGAHFHWESANWESMRGVALIWYDIMLGLGYLFVFWFLGRIVFWVGTIPARFSATGKLQKRRRTGEAAFAGVFFAGALLLGDTHTTRLIYWPSEECIYLILTVPLSAALAATGALLGFWLSYFFVRNQTADGTSAATS